MPSIKTQKGAFFSAVDGQSILAAASSNGMQLPYSCRTGRCSTCKLRVLSGQSQAQMPELGLSEQEQAQGWVLSCVRTAVSDLLIEVEDIAYLSLPQPRTLPCRLHSLDRLTADVMRVRLRLPPNSDFSFRAGQYIDVIAQGGLRRSYSLACASAVENQLELHVREVADGAMSAYWFTQAKEGDLLRMYGPLGTFVLRDLVGVDLKFLATGTGIAPVKAMIESLRLASPENLPRSISVYWGGRQPQDLYFDLASIMDGIHYEPVLSRASADWQGARGYVQQQLIADCLDLSDAAVYACGSDAMIQSARKSVIESGLPTFRFHSDAFVCSSAT